jgi:hypothetical protein
MVRRWLRHSLVTSPCTAAVAQALVIAITITGTGGGDFPLRR